MAYLKETNRAFNELAANNQQAFGLHLSGQIKSGRHGLYVGERTFDPARDVVTGINHMSLKAEAMGMPYVKQVLPHKPLAVNMVVLHRPGSNDPAIERGKQLLATSIKESIIQSKSSATDWLFTYLMGDMKEGVSGFDVVDRAPSDSRRTLRKLDQLCESGMGIVISDFETLDLARIKRRQFLGSIGLKFNYSYELALPANSGIWTLGDGSEVDTGKHRQLEKHNAASSAHHQSIMQELARVGMAAAQIVFEPDLYEPAKAAHPGFDISRTDAAIASVIRQAAQQ